MTDYAALIPIVIVALSGLAAMLAEAFRDPGERMNISVLGLIGLFGAALASVFLWDRDLEAMGVIRADNFTIFINLVLCLIGVLTMLFSHEVVERDNIPPGEYYALTLFAICGMMMMAAATDLLVIFIALEILSLSVYVLTGIRRASLAGSEAAFKYFILGAFSSAFFLYGIAFTFAATGSTRLDQIDIALAAQSATAPGPIALLAVGLLAVGFAFKTAAVPFHMWTPDAYEGAPSPVTGFMAAAVKAAAFVAFARVFLTAFPGLYDAWDSIAVWLAVLTMVAANLTALVEGNVKRMLAYSSIAHAGYLLVAVAAASQLGSASLLFYLLVYTLMTMGAFAIVMVVAGVGEGRLDLDAYRGLGWERPLIGVAMTIFLLSLAGFPLTGGFIGKVFILRASVEQGLILLAVVLVMTSLISYFYYLRVVWYMWFREPEPGTVPVFTVPAGVRVALVAAVIGVLLTGVFPGQVLEVAERSAATLTQAPSGLAGR